MKYLVIISFILLFSFSAAFASNYSSLVEDLPLTKQMHEIAEDFVSFEKPSGKIIQLTTITAESETQILNFYQRSLPPLGWQQKDRKTFTRENEVLKIEITKTGNNNYVSFNITAK